MTEKLAFFDQEEEEDAFDVLAEMMSEMFAVKQVGLALQSTSNCVVVNLARSLQINGVDNSVRLWDMRTLRPVSELVDHTEHEPRNQVRPERFFRLPKSSAVRARCLLGKSFVD